jgi:hypothetical protein
MVYTALQSHLTISSVSQTPKAFAALGIQMIPRLGDGVCSIRMRTLTDLIR